MRPAMSSILFACSLCLCTIAVNGSAADLYVPSQFPTIQAAIAQARIDRLSPNFPPDEIIVIHVGVGQYVEAFPLILDVPNLRLDGATILLTDEHGLPTGLIASETRLVAKPPLTGLQTILLIGPTSSELTGIGVTVQGLVLDAGNNGSASDGRDIVIDRVSDFSIRRNVLTGSAALAIDGRASSGVIEQNFIIGAGCGTCISAGNNEAPAHYSFLRNRSVENVFAGVLVAGSSYGGVLHPALLPVAAGTTFDSVTAVISDNNLSDNNHDPHFTSAIRLFAFIPGVPTAQTGADLDVSVTNNTLMNNSFGVKIDAGFAFRADQRTWTAGFRTIFSGNSISGSKRTPALISFTHSTAAIYPAALKDFKYLQDSTLTIRDSGGDLEGYWLDRPMTDPIDGRTLNNVLEVNGVTIANGRNFR